MRYIPSSQEDVRKMLADIGIASIEDLFTSIPSKYQYRGNFSFPKALSEQELNQHLWALSSRNKNMYEYA